VAGRFREPLDPAALRFSTSLPVDRALFREDIAGSIAHVDGLARAGVVSPSDARKIREGLRRIRREIERGKLPLQPSGTNDGRWAAEDIHMAVEARLARLIGPAAGRLHTARSRNDQVALDERLYIRGAAAALLAGIRALQRALVLTAEKERGTVMPGYTHLQRAQPVLLAHHLLAYVAMLDRDAGRIRDAAARANRSPLGAGALAGTPHPIDRRRTARALGFDGIEENSIDAVADRDALLELISAAAIGMMHLSRYCEELVLWSSQEWNFVRIGESYATGSSIMPQKRNPDIAELVRGKTGRVYGDLVALLTVMKGLPLAYNRDMQEDKEPLFDAVRTLGDSLAMAAGMTATLRFNRERFTGERGGDFLLATELADWLAERGVPFRAAHAAVGAAVRWCEERRMSLADMSVADLRTFSPAFDKEALALLSLHASVRRKRSAGSTAPAEVGKALRTWKRRLGA